MDSSFTGTWQLDRFINFIYESVRHRSLTQLVKPLDSNSGSCSWRCSTSSINDTVSKKKIFCDSDSPCHWCGESPTLLTSCVTDGGSHRLPVYRLFDTHTAWGMGHGAPSSSHCWLWKWIHPQFHTAVRVYMYTLISKCRDAGKKLVPHQHF